jgi:YecR-like lipoprotein
MTLTTLATLFIVLFLSACATQPSWSPSGSNRELGVARVAYEHARFEEPALSDVQAVQLAADRCATWGFGHAQMIPGELRECSVRNGEVCDIWKVTREYQCTGEGSLARAAAR